MNRTTIYVSESGIRSENVAHADAASHIAAGGSFATESQVLLRFIETEGTPNAISDRDGDLWLLTSTGVHGHEDFFIYELFHVGDTVYVPSENWTAKIVKILADGDLHLADEDNDGVYGLSEIERVNEG